MQKRIKKFHFRSRRHIPVSKLVPVFRSPERRRYRFGIRHFEGSAGQLLGDGTRYFEGSASLGGFLASWTDGNQ
ncbi:uncharacterized protein OCT59_018507 [Rhizophagus irregularis]|uniref:uncharacterized protein n=1 Tax=Rhizophagus irregularis TaxID=588596 RepID=UPI0033189F17|nr:hypothetical protein OCT59_027900 [Rhizophagus irregularis]UZO23412.1 hypothetical protein OCT59_015752 [Rhizophagus irregularis]UZO26269.1 hypothetical protein OCT59_018507 [Rhizophagus irregularis]